jgi:hypothetical protein
MRIRLLSALAVAAIALTTQSARAGYEFTFDQSAYVVNVGQTVNVNVYLTQTGSTTGLSAIGLNSGGVQLNYNTTFVSIAGVGSLTPNNTTYNTSTPTGFDPVNNSTVVGNGNATIAVGQVSGESAVKAGSGSPNTSNSILLGTFQFTGVSAGTSLVVSTAAFPGSDVNVLYNGTVIDSMITNSSAAITVVAVPEPGTLILTGLLATGIAGGYARKRRRPKIEIA